MRLYGERIGEEKSISPDNKAPLAKTYQLASLPPLAQLFLRTIASRENDIPSAALATAQGLFTLQSFTSRLQVWT